MFDLSSLPPLLPLWQDKKTRGPKLTSFCDLTRSGKTKAFYLVKTGQLKVVRLGARRTLVSKESAVAYLEKLAHEANTDVETILNYLHFGAKKQPEAA